MRSPRIVAVARACTLALAGAQALALGAGACASPSWQGALADADAQPLHARAELVLIAGHDAALAATLAEEALVRAAPGSEAEARAFDVLLAASDATGELERPLKALPRVLDHARDPVFAARVAAEAARAWARLDGKPATSEDVRAALVRSSVRPGDAWEPARAAALRELVTAERLRAGPAAGRAAAEAAGYVVAWRLSAPWGDAPALDLVTPLGPETRALAPLETTGAGWDLIAVPTTQQEFSDGEVTFFDLPSSGAVGFAEATLSAAAPRRVVVRLESNRAAALFIDGVPILRRELPSEPWLARAQVDVPAGAHRLTVKVASHDGRGFFRLQLTDLAPLAPAIPTLAARVVPQPAAPRVVAGDARAAVAALLDLEERLSRPRWDPEGARVHAERLEASFGPHDSLDLLAARLALGDASAPQAERRQRARTRYAAVLARHPEHPAARRGLARIERDDERLDRALALLVGPSGPGASAARDVRTRLELMDLYRARGWEAEALATAAALAPEAGTSPRVMQELVDLYKAFGRVADAERVARELVQRFPGSGDERLYAHMLDRGDVDPALPLSLFASDPQRHQLLRSGVTGLRKRGDLAAAERELARFLAQRPNDGWALGERVRLALQRDDTAAALALIDEALRREPDYAPLEQLAALLREVPEAFDTLEDGRAVLARWRAFRESAEGSPWAAFPIVAGLERTRVAVRADGSTVELAHRVRIVQTKQGADEMGDVRPPEGARLLVARTLKADGRVLEPERTPGKAELSFPELEPGDAVETAWVSRSRVSPSEGGYLTGVSFSAWGAPIFELDAQISAASGLDIAVKRFGGAPRPTLTTAPDGARVAAWSLKRLPPVGKEPMSVSARSFFPFADVRVVRAAMPEAERDADAWRRIARAYAARMTQLAAAGPRVRARADELAGRRDPVAAAFSWVKTEITDIEQLNAFETPVEAALAAKKGNRALVLWAILDALGVHPELYLCAPQRDGPPEDRAAPTPNPNRFFYPVIAVPQRRQGADAGPRFLDPARAYTPAGDLPGELAGAMCLLPLTTASEASAPSPRFVDLPAREAEPTFAARIDLALDAEGNARGTLEGVARGAAASPLRQAWLALDPERQRIFFEQWLASIAVGARLVDITVDDAASADAPMRWSITFELPGYAARDGAALVIQRPLKTLVHADLAGVPELAPLVSAPQRATPLRLLPFSEAVVLRLTAPPGMRVAAPPGDIDARGVTQRARIDGATVVVARTVDLRPGRVDSSEYQAFRADVGKVIRALEAPLRFEPAR